MVNENTINLLIDCILCFITECNCLNVECNVELSQDVRHTGNLCGSKYRVCLLQTIIA